MTTSHLAGGGSGSSGPGPLLSSETMPVDKHPAGHEAEPQDSERADADGGFGGLVLPMGAYVVKGGQVRWVSAVDITIAMLASLSLVRMLSRTWTQSRRRHGRS